MLQVTFGGRLFLLIPNIRSTVLCHLCLSTRHGFGLAVLAIFERLFGKLKGNFVIVVGLGRSYKPMPFLSYFSLIVTNKSEVKFYLCMISVHTRVYFIHLLHILYTRDLHFEDFIKIFSIKRSV